MDLDLTYMDCAVVSKTTRQQKLYQYPRLQDDSSSKKDYKSVVVSKA